MKKSLIALAVLAAAGLAHAGKNVPGNCGNGNGSGNACLPGATGGTSNNQNTNVNVNSQSSRASSQSSSASRSSANSSSSASGGSAHSASSVGNVSPTLTSTNTNAGNTTTVQGDTVNYRQAASTAYAPSSHGPRTSCRLFVGLGAGNVTNSLSGGVPIGNDQTCLSGAQIEFMDAVNGVAPGTFGAQDYLRAACQVEGMSAMAGCKPFAPATTVIRQGDIEQ